MEQNYKFSESHEWVKVEGNFAWVGISTYAAKKLGEIVFVDLPEVDSSFKQFEEFGAIESVKAASELFLPVSGTIVAVNEELNDQPEKINQNAAEAWIVKVQMSNPKEVQKLLDYSEYVKHCK